MEFKDRLRELRGKRTQKEIAKLLGVPLNSYNNWENGREPSYAVLKKIAEFYHVPVSYLKGETGKKENLTAQSHEVSDDDIKFALFGGGPVTDAQYEEVKQFVRFIKERDAHEQKDKL